MSDISLASTLKDSESPQPVSLPQPELPPTFQHKTLSAVFPCLFSLASLFTALSGQQFPKPDHPPEFQQFVHTTLCAFSCEESARKVRWDDRKVLVHQRTHDAVSGILREIHDRKKGSSVLLQVTDKVKQYNSGVNLQRPFVMNQHIHSPAAVFEQPMWMSLRHNIGDIAFRQLIVHSSLFILIDNNCFLQLSGEPLNDINLSNMPLFAQTAAPRVRQSKLSKRAIQALKRKREEEVATSEEGVMEGRESKDAKAPSPKKHKLQLSSMGIQRNRMFYGKPYQVAGKHPSRGLPPNHILNTCKPPSDEMPKDLECLKLLAVIFPSMLTLEEGRAPKVKGSNERLKRMAGIAREMLVRHSRANYHRILKDCMVKLEKETPYPCLPPDSAKEDSSIPVSQNIPSSGSELPKPPTSSRLASGRNGPEPPPPLEPKTQRQVCWFVRRVIKALFSTVILGSQHNQDVILASTRRFVTISQHETVSIHSILQDIRINDFEWLALGEKGKRVNQAEMEKRRMLVVDLLKWIFEGFLIPLLKNTFYITESANTKYETVYFTHDDWSHAAKPHFEGLKEKLLVSLTQAEKIVAESRKIGVSVVRLIPKPTGFRPIVNLGRPVVTGDNTRPVSKWDMKSTNDLLRDPLLILNYEKTRKRSLLGGALFGTNDFVPHIQQLKSDLYKRHGSKLPKLYFVKMDIKAAFDTIKQDRVLEIVEEILDQDHDYCIMMYGALLPPGNENRSKAPRKLYRSKAVADREDMLHPTFADHAREIVQSMRNAAMVDLARRRTVKTADVMRLLREHIKENTWQMGRNLYRQKTGIPQGSKVSSVLCAMFYSYLENEHLDWAQQKYSLLLRYTDDFLYITDNPQLAARFVKEMFRGFPDYGAHISPAKTLLSFECVVNDLKLPVADVNQEGEVEFPYCGFLINVKTLELKQDYTRMVGHPIKHSFALRSMSKKHSNLVTWLCRQLQNRNQIAHLNTALNSLDTVLFNVGTNFAFAAMKVVVYHKGHDIDERLHKHIFKSLVAAADYTYFAGRARVKHYAQVQTVDKPREEVPVRKSDFDYVAFKCMSRVLRRKASKYKTVVDSIEELLKRRIYRNAPSRWDRVVDQCWEAVGDAVY
ncbi:hypothetical protein I350_04244 [Cryptococcus amylolentus CBS 6273]|uniref:Telomerase reverse transcriptase n=1 Tax=Cryptococcus amylolentus CBS 6273 TaxID=1296118 RepID=A0A1E3K174_9TREE|nr:hypothetical protein I350_04244 [Cryptococcus amylolentus CBS 6273]